MIKKFIHWQYGSLSLFKAFYIAAEVKSVILAAFDLQQSFNAFTMDVTTIAIIMFLRFHFT